MDAFQQGLPSLINEIRELVKMEHLPSRDEFNEKYQRLRLTPLASSQSTENNTFDTYFNSTKVDQNEKRKEQNKRAIRKYYEISFESDSDSEVEVAQSSQESGTTDKESTPDTNPLPDISKDDIQIGDFYCYILNIKISIFTDTLKGEDFVSLVGENNDRRKRIELLNNMLEPLQTELNTKKAEIITAIANKSPDIANKSNDITQLDNEITKLKMKIALTTIYMLLLISPDDPNGTIAFYMSLLKKYSDKYFSKHTRGGNKSNKSRKSTRRIKQKRSRKSTRARKQKRTHKLTRK